MGGSIAWEMAHQLRREGETVALLALLDTSARLHTGDPSDESGKERLNALFLEDLRQVAGQPLPAVEDSPEQPLQVLRRVFEHHLQAAWTYEPPKDAGPFTLFEAEQSRWDHGWEPFAPGGLDVRKVPGDHYTFLKPPHVEVLAARLREALTQAQDTAKQERA